jgi:hypothetical protein
VGCTRITLAQVSRNSGTLAVAQPPIHVHRDLTLCAETGHVLTILSAIPM